MVENESGEVDIILIGSLAGKYYKNWATIKKPNELQDLKIKDCSSFSNRILMLSENKEKENVLHHFENADFKLTFGPFFVPNKEQVKKIQVNFYHGFAFLTENGTLYVYGNNTQAKNLGLNQAHVLEVTPLPQKTFNDKQIIDFSFGTTYMMVLTTEGSMYSCGSCSRGTLG